MSTIGTPIQTSLIQAAQAQTTASKAKDRERAVTEQARRNQDRIELRVAETESPDAVRKLPSNDSEQAEDEHQRRSQSRLRGKQRDDAAGEPGIDVKA